MVFDESWWPPSQRWRSVTSLISQRRASVRRTPRPFWRSWMRTSWTNVNKKTCSISDLKCMEGRPAGHMTLSCIHFDCWTAFFFYCKCFANKIVLNTCVQKMPPQFVSKSTPILHIISGSFIPINSDWYPLICWISWFCRTRSVSCAPHAWRSSSCWRSAAMTQRWPRRSTASPTNWGLRRRRPVHGVDGMMGWWGWDGDGDSWLAKDVEGGLNAFQSAFQAFC